MGKALTRTLEYSWELSDFLSLRFKSNLGAFVRLARPGRWLFGSLAYLLGISVSSLLWSLGPRVNVEIW